MKNGLIQKLEDYGIPKEIFERFGELCSSFRCESQTKVPVKGSDIKSGAKAIQSI